MISMPQSAIADADSCTPAFGRLQRRGVLWSLMLVAGVLGASPSFAAESQLPTTSPEGLKLQPGTKADAVYLRDGADFSGYTKVQILDCYVAFKKNYKRDRNSPGSPYRVTDEDMNRMKTNLAAHFRKVFTQELTAKGQTVVSGAGENVLTLRPAIINLDVAAPATMTPGQRTFSATAGQATLLLELYDSVTGDLLARAFDAEVIGDTATISVRNGVTNRDDADRLLKKWAAQLGNYLQKARESAKPGAAPAK